MNRHALIVQALVVATVGLTPRGAVAHHAADEVIARVDREIARRGVTVDLLVRRGEELCAVGRSDEAIDCYRNAIAQAPSILVARLGLAKALLTCEQWEEAVTEARAGSERAASAEAAAPFHAVEAAALERIGDTEGARAAWEAALLGQRSEVDWFLAHASLLGRSSGARAQLHALEAATGRNKSVVLTNAWIAALIECGDLEVAKPLVEQSLEAARWKSRWLLLRADIHRRAGEYALAKADAIAATEELRRRLALAPRNEVLRDQLARAEALLSGL